MILLLIIIILLLIIIVHHCNMNDDESVHCCLVIICWERRADLLALVCDVLLCFCHFLMLYPGLGVVLDCIEFGSLSLFALLF